MNNPLYKKVTLNLYLADVQDLARLYGYGWSERVRELIHDHLRNKQLHKIDMTYHPEAADE